MDAAPAQKGLPGLDLVLGLLGAADTDSQSEPVAFNGRMRA
jgi:hypothetical protein